MKTANPFFHSLESFSQNFLFHEDQNTLFLVFSLCTTKLWTCNNSGYTFPILMVPKQLKEKAKKQNKTKKKPAETKTQDIWVLIKTQDIWVLIKKTDFRVKKTSSISADFSTTILASTLFSGLGTSEF